MKLLYVEDNAVNVKLMAAVLRRRPGIELLTAVSAAEGLSLARAHRPALMLIDINLPGAQDGYGLLEQLRAEPELARVPVVAVSANAAPSDVERGLQAGFAAYVTKPFRVDELLVTVDRLLGMRPDTAG